MLIRNIEPENFWLKLLQLTRKNAFESQYRENAPRRYAAQKSNAFTLYNLLFYNFIDNGADLFNIAFDHVSRF